MSNDFLFELGCEELPSSAVWPLADEFAKHVTTALDAMQLSYSEVKSYASPRRLALAVFGLAPEKSGQNSVRRGPSLDAALDKDGQPTNALLGFAKSCGVAVENLTKLETDKGSWFVYESMTPTEMTKDLLPGIVSKSLAALSIKKPMRWGSGDEAFARPVHWAVMLYQNEVIDCSILGVRTGRASFGHRFHAPESIEIISPRTYESQLKDAYVVADFMARRQLIEQQVVALAGSLKATPIIPDSLLDEVSSIVEWPCALLVGFEEAFLEVPAESLIASMQSHQKCFALKANDKLLPYFITIANIQSLNKEQVVAGNEKVMRARLSDAAFFFHHDRKLPLATHIPETKKVVFQAKLGSLHDKTVRIDRIMAYLSQKLDIPIQHAQRAAKLSKCDLLTGMVGEFPELQGLMGYYYAKHDGEHDDVAIAINEQYMPRFAQDVLPQSTLGTALSLADRLDTLVGIFAIGQKPTGEKDPFKLRRHALAIVRLLTAKANSLELSELLYATVNAYKGTLDVDNALVDEIKTFILDRLYSFFQSQGFSADLIHAVLARQSDCLFDTEKRLQSLKDFVQREEAMSLSSACKRVSNLLSQVKDAASLHVDESMFIDEAERSLHRKIQSIESEVASMYRDAEYVMLLSTLASLKAPVDEFFDKIMVMVEDEAVRNNRLSLLAKLNGLLQGVADISLIQ